MVSIGDCSLGKAPKVVAIVDGFFPIEKIMEIMAYGANLLEMRIDCLTPPVESIVHYLDSLGKVVSLPKIGTVRENEWTAKNRVAIFKEILPYVDCIDLELGTPISAEVQNIAQGKTIIISEHDYEKTPDNAALNDIVKRSIDQGADIVKIATMATTLDDVRRLMWFTEQCNKPIVSIAMGPLGTVSRVIAPLFGSLFTYGYVEKPVAPGQLSAMKIIDKIKLFFPQIDDCPIDE
jgi:3-dehydroquinate dehydratase I